MSNFLEISQRRRPEIIFLRPGESATRVCGRIANRTITETIFRGEALVVICRVTGRRFVFVCGRRIRRVRAVLLPRRTRIVVKCVR